MELRHSIASDVATSRDGNALACCKKARALEYSGDFNGARDELTAYWRRVGERPDVAGLSTLARAEVLLRVGTLTCRLGSAAQIDGAIELAKDLATQSLTLFEDLKLRTRAAEACYALALCFRYEGSLDEARVWLNNALERAESADRESWCRILLLRAIVEKDAWRLKDSLEVLAQISELASGVDNHGLLGNYHHEHALVLKKLGTTEQNPAYLSQSLVEYEGARFHYGQAGNTRSLASTLNNIGCLLLVMHKPAEALPYVSESISLVEAVRDKTRQAEFLETTAQIQLALGNLADAEKAARRSVELLRMSGQHVLLSESLTTHGVSLARLQCFGLARRAFEEAEAVADHVGDKEAAGRALLSSLEELPAFGFNEGRAAYVRAVHYFQGTQDASIGARLVRCAEMILTPSPGETPEMSIEDEMSWADFSLDKKMHEIELGYIKQALTDTGGSLTDAASLLNVSPSNLHSKLNNKFKEIKHLQKPYVRRGNLIEMKDKLLPASHEIHLFHMPDDSLSDKGIDEGDKLVVKSGYDAANGSLVVLKSRETFFAGVYAKTEQGVELLPCNPSSDVWLFPAGSFDVVGVVLGVIKAGDESLAVRDV